MNPDSPVSRQCHFCAHQASTLQCHNCGLHWLVCDPYSDTHERCMDCEEALCLNCQKILPPTRCSSQSYCNTSATFLVCSETRSTNQICEMCNETIIKCYLCLHKGKRYTEEDLKKRHYELYHGTLVPENRN